MKLHVVVQFLCILALNINDAQGEIHSQKICKVRVQKIGIPDLEVPPNLDTVAATYGTFESRLDHFDSTNKATWTMRYAENKQFFVAGSPIFLFLGGEWAIDTSYIVTGQMYDMAKQHKGYMYYLEHRYYGSSIPTKNLTTDSLKWLSADQALADMSLFLTTKKQTVSGLQNSKVVVVGGSYSASLATWARLKYPDLVTASYASSAPLRAVADFKEYYEVLNDDIKLVSPTCLNTIAEGISQMENDLTTKTGISDLTKLIGSCKLIRTDEPYRSYFFNSIANEWANIVQYAKAGQINSECNLMLGYSGTSRDKLASYVKSKYGNYCMGNYDDFIKAYKNTSITKSTTRQWHYQTCTEFGFYQTTTSYNQPFGETFNVDLFIAMCRDLFGVNFSEQLLNDGIANTNTVYGSTQPNITYVVTVHGSVDPWHPLGLLHNLSDLAPATLVNGASHAADLSSASSSDSQQMAAAKKSVKDLVSQWLAK